MWLSTFDTNDSKLLDTDPRGHVKQWTYEASFNMLTETDALGKVTTYTYGPNRRMKTRADALGRVTTDTWDFFYSHRLFHADPTGASTGFLYNSKGWLETTTDPRSGVTTNLYSIEGNVAGVKDALGFSIGYGFDTNNRRISETRTRTKPGGTLETLLTQWVLDTEGRATKTILPDGSFTTMLYNKIGKPQEAADALGRVTKYEYDLLGRPTKTIFPDGTFESMTYDLLGRKATSVDRAGRTTSYGYDKVGRLILTTFPDGKTRAMAYDAAGRMTSETNENGHVTSYGYDAADRRISVTDASGTSPRWPTTTLGSCPR